jgi:hypothetical protein
MVPGKGSEAAQVPLGGRRTSSLRVPSRARGMWRGVWRECDRKDAANVD